MISRQPCRLNPRQSAHPLLETVNEAVVFHEVRSRLGPRRVPARRCLKFRLEHAADFESWIRLKEIPESANQQTRTRDEYEGERNFRNDQSRAKDAAITTAVCSATV